MRTFQTASRLVAAYASWALSTVACLAAVVGNATFTKPGVFRNSAGTTIVLSPGAPVAADDLVNTDREGRAKLRFLDGSNLDVGPGSQVKIDKYVYDPNRSAVAGAAVSLSKGVLRFISKGAPDGAYQFRTMTSTLAIRGTDFGLAFDPGPIVTTVQTFEGRVELCAKVCVLLKGSGGGVNTAIVDANGNVQTFNRQAQSGDRTLTFGMDAGVINPDGTSALADLGIGPAATQFANLGLLAGGIALSSLPAIIPGLGKDDTAKQLELARFLASEQLKPLSH
jgi:FecR-like protein